MYSISMSWGIGSWIAGLHEKLNWKPVSFSKKQVRRCPRNGMWKKVDKKPLCTKHGKVIYQIYPRVRRQALPVYDRIAVGDGSIFSSILSIA